MRRSWHTLESNPHAGNGAGSVSPILHPEEYYRLGFKILPCGIDLILRVTRAMQLALEDMRSGRFELMGSGTPLQEYLSVVGFEEWTRIEGSYAPAGRDATALKPR